MRMEKMRSVINKWIYTLLSDSDVLETAGKEEKRRARERIGKWSKDMKSFDEMLKFFLLKKGENRLNAKWILIYYLEVNEKF